MLPHEVFYGLPMFSQSPSVSSLAEEEEANAAVETCSAAYEPDGEQTPEETVNFFYLESPLEKHGSDELDSTQPGDQ